MCCFPQRLHDISGSGNNMGAAAVWDAAAPDEVTGLASAAEGSVDERGTPREGELLLVGRPGLACVGSVVRRDVVPGIDNAVDIADAVVEVIGIGLSEFTWKADLLGVVGFEVVVCVLRLLRNCCLPGSVVVRSFCDIRRLRVPDSEVEGRSFSSLAERAACLEEVTESAAGGSARVEERVLP